MSEPEVEQEVRAELAPAVIDAASPGAPAQTARPALAPGGLPLGRPATSSALERAQLMGHRALAETAYRLRRLGATTVVGIAAGVAAATLFIANNLPQGSAVAALRAELVRLAPVAKGAAIAPSAGAMLAALPSRGEAPSVVAKILEEARASGVELPRGQYEYIPARDGVAARYRMTFPVTASYPKIREFMDRTLLALPAVAVEGLRIERKNVGDGTVEAEIRLAAFVRSDE